MIFNFLLRLTEYLVVELTLLIFGSVKMEPTLQIAILL